MYAAVRATGLLVLAVWAAARGESAHARLTARWDALWYARIAEDGYGYEVRMPDGDVHADLAFFPLLPALERGLAAASPLAVNDAGLVVGWTASLAAAWGIWAVAALLGGRALGVALVALWGAYPTAFVQSMAYTETLFTALAAWTLYLLLTGRMAWAGALAAVAGLTRPTAAALVLAVWVAAYRERRWGAAALAPLGFLAYTGFVGVRRGNPLGYFEVQAGWDNGFDGGLALLGFVWDNLMTNVVGGLGMLALLALVGWLLWLGRRQGQPLPVWCYTAAVVVVSLVGSGYFGSRPRLMMPAFPLLLPAALALLRQPRPRAVLLLTAAALASAVFGAVTLLGPGPP